MARQLGTKQGQLQGPLQPSRLGNLAVAYGSNAPFFGLQYFFFFEEEMYYIFAMFFSALLNYSIFPASPSLSSEEQKSDGIC